MVSFVPGQPFPIRSLVECGPSMGWHNTADGPVIVSIEAGMTAQRAQELWRDARLWLVQSGPLLVVVAMMAGGDAYELPMSVPTEGPLPAWVTGGAGGFGGLGVRIVSVSHPDGIVAAVESVTLSERFSRAVAEGLAVRARAPLSAVEHAEAVRVHRSRFPGVVAMLPAATASTRLTV